MFEYHTKEQWRQKLEGYQRAWNRLKLSIANHDEVGTKVHTDQIDQFNRELEPLFKQIGITE